MRVKATPTAAEPRSQRADARRNYEHLLTSAAATFVREGPRVTMQTLAHHAGVGVGTLYRHFPNRDALLAALQTRAYATVLDLARAARASMNGDALGALRSFLFGIIDHRDEIVLPFTGATVDPTGTNAPATRAISEEIGAILTAGQGAGLIRQDVGALDLMIAGAYLARRLPNLPDEPTTACRQAAIFVAGLRSGDAPLGDEALTLADLERDWYTPRD